MLFAAAPPLVGARPEAALADPVILYVNREGGAFTPGEPNDSRENVTSVPDQTVAVDPWEVGDDAWQELMTCVDELFAPFDIAITDADPGSDPHIEAVLGSDPTSFGLLPTVAGVSPFLSNCGIIDNSIVFVFPSVVGDDPRRLCETVAQEVAHSFGLDHQYLCEDPMTYLTGCGNKQFLFQESVCGEFEQRDCKCSRSQNSARMLLDRVGRGDRPALWLTEPSPGDVLAAGFVVQAAITHAPLALELYVDGVLVDAAEPDDTGESYQLIDFDTRDSLRSGTHTVELFARYGDEDLSVTALVEVEGVESENLVSEGCAVSGGGRGPLAGLILALLVVLGRGARRRPPAAAGLLALVGLLAGCQTTVSGGGPDDIESGCQGAGDVSAAIGVLWSAPGGPCTGTLVAPDGVMTAAHCVAGAGGAAQPVVAVLGGRQYVGDTVVLHPDWAPGAPDNDVASVTLTRAVADVEPLALAPEVPESGVEFTLVGHGDWSPTDLRDPERQALAASTGEVQELSFSYDEAVEDGCLGARGGGPVVVSGAPDRLLGLHGEGRSIMRMDQYACWLACGAGPDAVASLNGCDCARAMTRPCNECGAEYLDQDAGAWSVCTPAEEVRPCEEGLTCDGDGYCVL